MQTIRFHRYLVAVLLTLAGARLSCAEISTASIVQDMQWRLVGPFRGGRTRAIAGVPGHDQRSNCRRVGIAGTGYQSFPAVIAVSDAHAQASGHQLAVQI